MLNGNIENNRSIPLYGAMSASTHWCTSQSFAGLKVWLIPSVFPQGKHFHISYSSERIHFLNFGVERYRMI